MRRLVITLSILLAPASAFAQQARPIAPFALDIRGVFGFLNADAITAADIGATTADLAGHPMGVGGGVHLYPLRGRSWALGLGGEVLVAGATQQNFDPIDPTIALGPEVTRRFRSLSGQLSLNFGHRGGWSYLTAGMGPLQFDTFVSSATPDGVKELTPNFGFGARWFSTPHVAFSVDLRFFMTKPAPPTLFVGGRDRAKVTMISAGISLK
jgi:hypothetical protein